MNAEPATGILQRSCQSEEGVAGLAGRHAERNSPKSGRPTRPKDAAIFFLAREKGSE